MFSVGPLPALSPSLPVLGMGAGGGGGGGGGGKAIAIAIMLLSVYYESIMQKDQLVVGASRFLQIPSLSGNC